MKNIKTIIVIVAIWAVLFFGEAFRRKYNVNKFIKNNENKVKESLILTEKYGNIGNVKWKKTDSYKNRSCEIYEITSGDNKYQICVLHNRFSNNIESILIDNEIHENLESFNYSEYIGFITDNSVNKIINYSDYIDIVNEVKKYYNIESQYYDIKYDNETSHYLIRIEVRKKDKVLKTYYTIISNDGRIEASWNE